MIVVHLPNLSSVFGTSVQIIVIDKIQNLLIRFGSDLIHSTFKDLEVCPVLLNQLRFIIAAIHGSLIHINVEVSPCHSRVGLTNEFHIVFETDAFGVGNEGRIDRFGPNILRHLFRYRIVGRISGCEIPDCDEFAILEENDPSSTANEMLTGRTIVSSSHSIDSITVPRERILVEVIHFVTIVVYNEGRCTRSFELLEVTIHFISIPHKVHIKSPFK